MFTALTLSLALGAPVPAPAPPVATGVAPRVMELKADTDGKVMVAVTRTEMVQVGGGAVPPNGARPAVIARQVRTTKMVELGEVKDLTITTADGKKLTTEEATKKLAGGAIVVVSGDGKPVSPAFLKVFKDDTLVLASPELTSPQGGGVIGRPGGVVRPLPAQIQPGQVLPIQPGNIQILPVQGGGVIQIEVAPAVLPVEKPAVPPQKNEK
jgi:hypothetical protein